MAKRLRGARLLQSDGGGGAEGAQAALREVGYVQQRSDRDYWTSGVFPHHPPRGVGEGVRACLLDAQSAMKQLGLASEKDKLIAMLSDGTKACPPPPPPYPTLLGHYLNGQYPQGTEATIGFDEFVTIVGRSKAGGSNDFSEMTTNQQASSCIPKQDSGGGEWEERGNEGGTRGGGREIRKTKRAHCGPQARVMQVKKDNMVHSFAHEVRPSGVPVPHAT